MQLYAPWHVLASDSHHNRIAVLVTEFRGQKSAFRRTRLDWSNTVDKSFEQVRNAGLRKT